MKPDDMLIKKCLLAFSLFASLFVSAQEPAHWEYHVKKISDNMYEVHMTATVQSPWHIYSQGTPDGGPVATQFSFAKNPLVIADTVVKEIGELIKKHEAVFGVDVHYYEGKVDFVEAVRLRTAAKTSFSGTVKYMLCNDRECLPPRTASFSINLF
jgi:hypothetical protein